MKKYKSLAKQFMKDVLPIEEFEVVQTYINDFASYLDNLEGKEEKICICKNRHSTTLSTVDPILRCGDCQRPVKPRKPSPELPSEIVNKWSVTKSQSTAGQREMLREHTNKINQLIRFLKEKGEK